MIDHPRAGRLRQARRVEGTSTGLSGGVPVPGEYTFYIPREIDRDDTEIEAMVAVEALDAENTGS